MAERSVAFLLRKMGGRQNVVQLRALKRTRLASQEHVWFQYGQPGYTYRMQGKKKIPRAPTNSWSMTFDFAHVASAMLRKLHRKNKRELKFQQKIKAKNKKKSEESS